MNKYHAVKVTCDDTVFDSTFEFNTYKTILSAGIKDVSIHHPVTIFNGNNCFYEPLQWKCDFYLPEIDVYIESKGILHRDFKLRMMMLTTVNPDIWDKLIFVTYKPKKPFLGDKNSVNFAQLREILTRQLKMSQINRRVKNG